MKLPLKTEAKTLPKKESSKKQEASDSEDYETVSEHSIDSQGNSIKHSSHSSEWESESEESV